MCFLSQVALAHGGFNQTEMLSSELQAHDVTVTQLQQEVIAVLINLQIIFMINQLLFFL